MKTFSLALIGFLLVGQRFLPPEEPERIFAAGPKVAYYMEPADLAAKAYVRRLLWTADGSVLVSERLVPPVAAPTSAVGLGRQTPEFSGLLDLEAHVQLVAWGRRSRVSHILAEFDPRRQVLQGVWPLAGSDRLVVSLREAVEANDRTVEWRNAVMLVGGNAGSILRLWSASKASENAQYQPSPKRPLGALVLSGPPVAGRGPDARLLFFGANGALGSPLALAPDRYFAFAADGSPGVGIRRPAPNGRWTREFHAMNPQTGAPGAVAVESGFEQEVDPEPTLSSESHEGTIRLKVVGGKPEESGLVTTDGAAPEISPKNDAVAYLSGGSTYVRCLDKLDRKDYDALMLESERRRATRYAKEAGTALNLYSQDADGAFPPGGDIPNVAGPYARNGVALRALIYTFGGGVPGGPLDQTEIGYVPGPGGRAVVYGDGSVRWVPDAP